MKTILVAATLAILSAPVAAPLQAASLVPVAAFDGAIERHGCDTPRDIREHKRCR